MPSLLNYYKPIWMDGTVTVDGSSFGTNTGTFAFTHYLTAPSGSNRALIISLGSENQGTDTTVSAATYNGTALTLLDTRKVTSSGFFAEVRQYIIKEADLPATAGTYNVSFSASTATSTGGTFLLESSITRLHNVSQDATILNYGAISTSSSVLTVSAVPTVRGSWVVSSAQCGQSGTYAVPFPQVETYEMIQGASTTHSGSVYKFSTDSTTLGITENYTGGAFNRHAMTATIIQPSL